MSMKPYVIRQGDYLLKVAHLRGFDADTAWNHPKNAELKALRSDPSMLKPGDVLFVPDEPKPKLKLNAKETNVFVARVPTVKVALVVAHDGEPLANAKYVVEGLGRDEEELSTDAAGTVTVEAPVHVREVVVRFVETGARLSVGIGDLDPPDTPSGARMRLTSLGYGGAKAQGKERSIGHDADSLRAAVSAFQVAQGLPKTGELDDATRAALVAAHGS